jgi:hypothetical protein
MEHEGMVHALEEIKRLLRQDGCLIDIHPVQDAPLIEVRTHDVVLFSEPSASYDDDDDDLKHAEDALAWAIGRALFALDRSHEFEFVTIASSVSELRDYFAVSNAYEEGPLDKATEARVEELYARVDEVMQSSGDNARVIHRERARMARLNPVS